MQEEEQPKAKRKRADEAAVRQANDQKQAENKAQKLRAAAPASQQPSAAGRVKPEQPPRVSHKPSQEVSLARTVFVRGLPVDTDRYQLQRALEVYGPLIACRSALCPPSRPTCPLVIVSDLARTTTCTPTPFMNQQIHRRDCSASY